MFSKPVSWFSQTFEFVTNAVHFPFSKRYFSSKQPSLPKRMSVIINFLCLFKKKCLLR